MTATTAKWDIFELVLQGPADGNPFVDVALSATFMQANRAVEVPGFYDGDGVYRVRFMPDNEGTWRYETRSTAADLDGKGGSFDCVAAAPGDHGPVRVRGQFHFAHADGTAFFPFGTTCYAWTHQPLSMQAETLATLARARFNKIRMAVFPKHYLFNENEPLYRAFEQRDDHSEDFDRPNVAMFRHFERQVQALGELAIQADVIIFHPYDRWGYCTMSAEQDYRYVRYLTARLAAFANVWWSLANEYDFLLDVKPIEQWDRYFQIIEENDPYRHLKSIHNGEETMNFDHRKPWVDYVCIQNWNVKATTQWRNEWRKPIVNDELEYEGDIVAAWGNLTAQELVHRFWITVTRGGYAGHGETYRHPLDLLWWAKGGTLRGESWRRIGFLRDLIESDVKVGLEPAPPGTWPWTRVSFASEGDFRLIYFGEHQPGLWIDGLPETDGDYDVDIIDTWEMTITPANRVPTPTFPRLRQRGGALSPTRSRAAFAIEMPAKPYMAIRVKPYRT